MSTTETLARIRIDRRTHTAAYIQLYAEVRRLVEEGRLPAGERLPTVVELSSACGLSRTTVVRALAELAAKGVVIPRWGSGNYVAEPRVPATELLVHGAPTKQRAGHVNTLYDQIVAAFAEVATGGKRRMSLSYTQGRTPSAKEILDIAAARGADSLAVYRPDGEFALACAEAARSLPTVALFHRLPDAPADAVIADPSAPLRAALRRRIEAGQRRFFLLFNPAMSGIHEDSPYAAMCRAFRATLLRAGLQAGEHALEGAPDQEGLQRELRRVLGSLPPGTTVVTHTFYLADLADLKFDLIGYTESAHTVERYGARCSMLHLKLNALARPAMKLLMARKARGGAAEPQIVRVEPAMIERAQAQKNAR